MSDEMNLDFPIFSGMSDEYRARIASVALIEEYAADERLFRMGDPANASYLIQSGRLSLEVQGGPRGTIRIETLEGGDAAGFSWLFPPHRWAFDGRAVDPLRVIALDGAQLRVLKSTDHEFGYEMMLRYSAVITDRLQATRMQLMDFYGDHG
ncbi:MAG: cyclic nucleotide-binding domain-containing protein [Acidimicrobiia bacterium]|nr:cyclic nucleotide-binding domain-containing protein [Acidimicrobiia bacterium]